MIENNPDQKTQSNERSTPFGILIKKLFACPTEKVKFIGRTSEEQPGISRVGTHFMGSNRASNRLDSKQICHAVLPDQSTSTIALERM